jgi:hypothetical protein
MAVAGRDASVPAIAERVVGDSDRAADETDGAGPALRLPEHLVALHGFIKKTRMTSDDDLALARKRQKELER